MSVCCNEDWDAVRKNLREIRDTVINMSYFETINWVDTRRAKESVDFLKDYLHECEERFK